jgi:hypothetical protein
MAVWEREGENKAIRKGVSVEKTEDVLKKDQEGCFEGGEVNGKIVRRIV